MTENWHEERDRLRALLEAVDAGGVSHVDQDGLRQLQAATPAAIARLRARLAVLEARLGEHC